MPIYTITLFTYSLIVNYYQTPKVQFSYKLLFIRETHSL